MRVYSSGCNISNVYMYNVSQLIISGMNNTFSNITSINSSYIGVYQFGGSNNTYSGLSIAGAAQYGIYFTAISSNVGNQVYNSTFSGTQTGIFAGGVNVTLSNVTSCNNSANGLWLRAENSTISGSNFCNNSGYQVSLDWGAGNNLFYNNILNASAGQGVAYDNTTTSFWNTTKAAGTNIIGGPYIGGNYYSTYNGTDLNGDGIGDAPYGISGGSGVDYLPLVIPPALPQASVSLNSPANGTLTGSPTPSFSWTTYNFTSPPQCNLTVDGAALSSVSCAINSSCTASATLADGTHSWAVSCYNGSQSAASAARTIIIDVVPPMVSITSPASNSILGSTSITVTVSVSDANLNYTSISVIAGGAAVNSTVSAASGNYSVILAVPSAGSYNITATAYDLAGNANTSAAFNITADLSGPSISIQSPANATYNSSAVQLNFTVSDPSGVASCSYSIDGAAPAAGCANATLPGLADGAHTVVLNATDSVGNRNFARVSFSVVQIRSIIRFQMRNSILFPIYLEKITLDNETAVFAPPIRFAPGQVRVVGFGTSRSFCSAPGQLVQLNLAIYYSQGVIGGLVQAGTVPLALKCS